LLLRSDLMSPAISTIFSKSIQEQVRWPSGKTIPKHFIVPQQ
jgi:hypothetical protein